MISNRCLGHYQPMQYKYRSFCSRSLDLLGLATQRPAFCRGCSNPSPRPLLQVRAMSSHIKNTFRKLGNLLRGRSILCLIFFVSIVAYLLGNCVHVLHMYCTWQQLIGVDQQPPKTAPDITCASLPTTV